MAEGYEPTALRCEDCGHELLTPARLLADRDRDCPVCSGDMAPVAHHTVRPDAVSPWG